jgi:hypothetical protein
VEKAHRRIEARRSQASLKADIAEKCRLVNDKKEALDAKTNTSESSQRLELLERELEDRALEDLNFCIIDTHSPGVRATKWLI